MVVLKSSSAEEAPIRTSVAVAEVRTTPGDLPDLVGDSPGINDEANGEEPKGFWIDALPDDHFDKFGGAVCFDIRRTYDEQDLIPFALPGSQKKHYEKKKESTRKTHYETEESLIKFGLGNEGLYGTKIIFCLRSRDPRDGLMPLPMSRNLFEKITKRCRFSPMLFKVLDTGLATACRQTSETHEHVMFQQNATGMRSVSMAVSYDHVQKSTVVLVFGARDTEAEILMDVLEFCNEHWMATPLAALDSTAQSFSQQIRSRHNEVWKVGADLKMDQWARDIEHFDIKTLDLTAAIRTLNSLFIELAYFSQACQTSQSLLSDLSNMLEADSSRSPSKNKREGTLRTEVRREIQRLKSWYDGIQARSDYLTRRVEALRQTVYNLTAQRDSAINLEIAQRSSQVAEQSMTIAQLSRQDNIAMKEVAIAAVKDSAAMRVIAAVTLFFLPPTFVATFFSTSFLDFKPSEPGDHVSSWIWLYFVLTVVLMVTVMGCWRWSTRHALRAIPQLQQDQAEKSGDGTSSA